jgi:hypothetical protein
VPLSIKSADVAPDSLLVWYLSCSAGPRDPSPRTLRPPIDALRICFLGGIAR